MAGYWDTDGVQNMICNLAERLQTSANHAFSVSTRGTFGHSLFYASIAFGGEWTQNALKVTAKVKQKMLVFTRGLKTNNFRVYGLFIHVTGKQHHRDKHCHHGSPHPPLPPSPPHPHPHPPHHHHHLVPNHEIIANQMLSSDTPKLAKSFGNGMEPSGLVT